MDEELLELFCFGIGQGEKLRISNRLVSGLPLGDSDQAFFDSLPFGVGVPGEHIEAMRVTMIRIVKRMPTEFQRDLKQALEDVGIEIDLALNESQKP